MATSKAQIEKEKGNTAFKAGDYPTAIGRYTAAILADGQDYTFPLNRAAAYLKLGKNEDAERDCTRVLTLNALNAKALFRRGQARLAMGKLEEASTDLSQASNREPANSAIKDEAKKVADLLVKRRAKSSKPLATPPALTPVTRRRRVPIMIVDTAAKATPSASSDILTKSPTVSLPQESSIQSPDTLKPVSTRSFKPDSKATPSELLSSTSPTATSAPAPTAIKPEQQRTFKDAKQTRENGKPSRVGGGIFRASGESTIFPTRSSLSTSQTPAPQAKPQPTPAPAAIVPVMPENPPKTLFDFTRAWDAQQDTAARWGLILSIPPSGIPTLFKISLEPTLLTSILEVFREVSRDSKNNVEMVKEYMGAFGRVERFGTVVLFLSGTEKETARGVWEALGVTKENAEKVWSPVWD